MHVASGNSYIVTDGRTCTCGSTTDEPKYCHEDCPRLKEKRKREAIAQLLISQLADETPRHIEPDTNHFLNKARERSRKKRRR